MSEHPTGPESAAFARSDYAFDLPPDLIAQEPLAERDAARLLIVPPDPGAPPVHRTIRDLPGELGPRDRIVLNDTIVRPARVWARRATGARVEVLLLRLTEDRAAALIGANRRIPDGERVIVADGIGPGEDGEIEIGPADAEGVRALRIPEGWLSPHRLQALGVPPLPPYIRRDREDPRLRSLDRDRYQTVFAAPDSAGADGSFSVAAPTAGLHFTPALLDQLATATAGITTVTLHVGLGTFRPVKADDIREHTMHAETFRVRRDSLAELAEHRASGGRLVCIGTTTARVIESITRLGLLPPRPGVEGRAAAMDGVPATYAESADGAAIEGETRLFLHPPDRPLGVDGLLTNFHLPESTLLMLVATMLGREQTLAVYREAIAQRYRFFSYGDAMLLRIPAPAPEGGA